jgi:hypothetical protein
VGVVGATEATVNQDILAPQETVKGRGFTDPARTAEDLAALRVMLAVVRHVATAPGDARPFVVEGREVDGRLHRTIVCNGARLRDGRDLAWVGFFGTKRPDVDATPLRARDDELIREFPAHPGILSYSSLEVGTGDWGNLILLDGGDAREQWRTSARHAHAVRELAPRHYTDVRLHLGVLARGVAGGELRLHRTKYFDYRDAWRGERVWPA